jgi:hypothetical protein
VHANPGSTRHDAEQPSPSTVLLSSQRAAFAGLPAGSVPSPQTSGVACPEEGLGDMVGRGIGEGLSVIVAAGLATAALTPALLVELGVMGGEALGGREEAGGEGVTEQVGVGDGVREGVVDGGTWHSELHAAHPAVPLWLGSGPPHALNTSHVSRAGSRTPSPHQVGAPSR